MLIGDDRDQAGASAALARVDALHTGLTQIVLEGGNLDGIAAEVARVLDVGVLFTSTDGRERAAALTDQLREQLATHDLIDPTGRLRVERVGPEAVPVGSGEIRSLRVAAGGTDLARLVCLRSTEDDLVRRRARAGAGGGRGGPADHPRECPQRLVDQQYQGHFLRDLFLRRAGDEEYVTEHADTLAGSCAGRGRGGR